MSAERDTLPGADLHLLGQREESPSEQPSPFTDHKDTRFQFFFYPEHIFQAEKEKVPGTQGQLHQKVSDLEDPHQNQFHLRCLLLFFFSSYKKYPEIFYCACGTFMLLLHCEDRQCILLDLSTKYV